MLIIPGGNPGDPPQARIIGGQRMMILPGGNIGVVNEPPARFVSEAEIRSSLLNIRCCLYILFFLSFFMFLRVQQERYTETLQRPGGVPDAGKPFLWESAPFIRRNETFEATFLHPLDPQSGSFSQIDSEHGTILSGPAPVLMHHDGHGIRHEPLADHKLKITALTFTSPLTFGGCPPNSSTCYIASKRSEAMQSGSCHRFLMGSSVATLREFSQGNRTKFCLKSSRIASLVPDADSGSIYMNWQPRGRARFLSCLAKMSLTSFEVTPVATMELAYAVFKDDLTGFIIAVGYSAVRTVIVRVLQAETLRLRWKFRLPLSVGWLIRSKSSAGYVVFLGSQEPFLGTAFVVDLKLAHVYQQEPPSIVGGRLFPRRRLPSAMVLEHPDPTENGRFFTTTKPNKDEACVVGVH